MEGVPSRGNATNHCPKLNLPVTSSLPAKWLKNTRPRVKNGVNGEDREEKEMLGVGSIIGPVVEVSTIP